MIKEKWKWSRGRRQRRCDGHKVQTLERDNTQEPNVDQVFCVWLRKQNHHHLMEVRIDGQQWARQERKGRDCDNLALPFGWWQPEWDPQGRITNSTTKQPTSASGPPLRPRVTSMRNSTFFKRQTNHSFFVCCALLDTNSNFFFFFACIIHFPFCRVGSFFHYWSSSLSFSFIVRVVMFMLDAFLVKPKSRN